MAGVKSSKEKFFESSKRLTVEYACSVLKLAEECKIDKKSAGVWAALTVQHLAKTIAVLTFEEG